MREVLLVIIATLLATLCQEVSSAGSGDNFQLLATMDERNPHVVSEVISAAAVSCYVAARDIEGDVLTLTCPSGCQTVTEKLWGTGKYREDSYVCAAAIHDGRISVEGGTLTIRKLKGEQSFLGSTRNGVTTQSSVGHSSGLFFFQDSFEARRKLYTVSCFAKADLTLEDSFMVICPPGCDVVSENVWGGPTYASKSYLCASAIHAGHIKAAHGGRIIVNKKPGQAYYNGSAANGIESQNFGSYRSSFVVEGCPQTLSSVLSVGCSFRADHVMEDVLTVVCPPGCGDSNSEVTGTGPYSVRSHVCAAAVHHGQIDGLLGGKVTVIKQKEATSFERSRRNGVTTMESKARSGTFLFGASIRNFPNLMQVSCETTADLILEDVFSVNCPARCLDPLIRNGVVIGSGIYATSSPICSSAIHDGRITDKEGGPVTVRRIGGKNAFVPEIRNGIQSSGSDQRKDAFVFGGHLEDVKTALRVSCEFAPCHAVNEELTISCPRGCPKRNPRGFIDNSEVPFHRASTSVCPLSAKFADREVTVFRALEGTEYKASLDTTNWDLIERPAKGQYAVTGRIFPQSTVISVSCDAQANHINDVTFTAICPPGCNGTKVWGTEIYSDDSQICASAVHDGRISAARGGSVTLRKLLGMDSYAGSENNGIESSTRNEPWMTSFVFQSTLYHRTSVFTITCAVQGSAIKSKEYGVVCPRGCRTAQDYLWGTGTYSQDSSICTAAIHDGKITDEGGIVRVYRVLTRTDYAGSRANGVFSRSKQNSGESSFAFRA